ncbi:hypothetical protein ACV4W0_19420, partial [Pseudomonas aeruginosa]
MAASRLSAKPLPSPCAPPGMTRNRNVLTSISESAIYPTTWSVLMLWVDSVEKVALAAASRSDVPAVEVAASH